MAEAGARRDVDFMREALRMARRGLGRTSPNPAVGAVVVSGGVIVARGYHRRAGMPHAEVEALGALDGRAPGATLYVTLEPCNHFGKTPPCTRAIVEAGVKRVVVGMMDPNPHVEGGGCDYLAGCGIEIATGVLERECSALNEQFIRFVTSGRPFVTVKSALTMDGWTGTSTGHSKWVTNEQSRRFVHRLRDRVDAVMVGVGTVLADDPRLTTRLASGRAGRDPVRIVVDTNLRTPPEAKVVRHDSPADTILAVGMDVPPEKVKRVLRPGVRVLRCAVVDGKVDLPSLLGIVAGQCITGVLVEGGASVVGSLIRQRLVDKFLVFRSPRLLGGDDGIPMARGAGPTGMDRCLVLRDIRVRRFGDDVLTVGYPDYPDDGRGDTRREDRP